MPVPEGACRRILETSLYGLCLQFLYKQWLRGGTASEGPIGDTVDNVAEPYWDQ